MRRWFESWVQAWCEWWYDFRGRWGFGAPIIPVVLGMTLLAVVIYMSSGGRPEVPRVTQNVGFGDHGADISGVEARVAMVEEFMAALERRLVNVEGEQEFILVVVGFAVAGCGDVLDLRACLEAWAVAVRQGVR
jgi:hypothetical protein